MGWSCDEDESCRETAAAIAHNIRIPPIRAREWLDVSPPCAPEDSGETVESQVGEPVAANAANTANGHSPLNTCDFPNTEHLKPKTLGEADSEPIGTTSNHPFWSADRQEFVQAGSLEIGERLQTLSEDVKDGELHVRCVRSASFQTGRQRRKWHD